MILVGALELRSCGGKNGRSGHVSATVADVGVEVSPTEDHVSLVKVSQSML